MFSHDQPQDFLKSQVSVLWKRRAFLKNYFPSQWQRGEKSTNFLIYKLTLAIFFAFSVAYSMNINTARGHFHVYFIYWTHLNLCGTVVMTLLGAVFVSLYYFDKIRLQQKMPKISSFIGCCGTNRLCSAC